MAAANGALQGWRGAGPLPVELSALQTRYLEDWDIYTGEWLTQAMSRNPYRNDPRIYTNTRLLWKHAESIVDFYAAVVYQGALPTDDQPLPNGAVSAIPIKPQTPTKERSSQLLLAIAELYGAWNWQQQMSLRPMYAAALGDVLTEIVDDTKRGFVYPKIVWPGYVKEIELDDVGNVRRYVLEYYVAEKRIDGSAHQYLFRKEIDGEDFRYFRDDKPYDQYGNGAVVPNPYGFVPAVWDRHRIGAPGHVRGRSALSGTRQALIEYNSIFSHGLDHQRKIFFAPLMVTKKPQRKTTDSDLDLSRPPTANPAESFDVVGVPDGAQLLQPTFDIGDTLEFLKSMQEGILAENPESSFYQQMREMQQVTAPGAERLMGDVKNRVDLVRAGQDSGTVKVLQMATAIAGMRANGRDWKRDANGRAVALTRRQKAFLPFDLYSFERGEMDFVIESRPIVYPTEQERLDIIATKESLTTQWGMEEAGMPPDVASGILADRRERFAVGMSTGAFGTGDYG